MANPDHSYDEADHITVQRNYHESPDTSSLKIESDHLLVIGVLHHCSKISFNPEDALKLRDWLNRTYNLG